MKSSSKAKLHWIRKLEVFAQGKAKNVRRSNKYKKKKKYRKKITWILIKFLNCRREYRGTHPPSALPSSHYCCLQMKMYFLLMPIHNCCEPKAFHTAS